MAIEGYRHSQELIMFRIFIVCLISMGIGACASTTAEAPTAAGSAASTSSGSVTADNPAAEPMEEGVPKMVASDMPQTANAEPEYDPNEIICKREKQTGSKFSVKTCATRAELEARQKRDQEMMESMSRRQSGGACAMSNDC